MATTYVQITLAYHLDVTSATHLGLPSQEFHPGDQIILLADDARSLQAAGYVALATPISAVPLLGGPNTWTGNQDFTGATVVGVAGGGSSVGIPTIINVKDAAYGAKGNGTTDDTAAIQAALTAAAALSGTQSAGGTVYLPAGTYKVTGGLTLAVDGITIRGAGAISTAIVTTSTTAHLFSASGHRRFTFEDLKLVGAGTGTVDAINLAAPGAYAVFDCVFRNLHITGFGRHGIHTEDACGCVFDHVRIESCGGNGFDLGGNGNGLGGTSNAFTACYALACTFGYSINSVVYSNFSACSTDSCTTGYVINACTSLSFNGCGVESTTGTPGHGFAVYNGSSSIAFTSCYALNIVAAGSGFKVGANGGTNCSRIVFTACRVLGSTTPTFSLQVDAASQATAIGFQKHPSAANATTGSVNYVSDENTGDFALVGNLNLGVVGKGLQVKAGTNGRIGTATLVNGTVTISNSSVGANTTVLAMAYNIIGTPGFLAMSGRSNGVSFAITSYTGAGAVNTADNSSFTWVLVERT